MRERVHDLPNIPRKLGAKKGSGIEHVSWDVRSHYTFLPPKERRDKVLESYKFSLPLELREEFQKEFEKDDSNTVNINLGVRSVNIGCSLVNSTRNWNRYQKGSEVIATLPVSTEMSLNGSIENFSNQEWCAPTRKGEFSFLTFNVEDNTQRNLIRLYAQFDCTFL